MAHFSTVQSYQRNPSVHNFELHLYYRVTLSASSSNHPIRHFLFCSLVLDLHTVHRILVHPPFINLSLRNVAYISPLRLVTRRPVERQV